MSPGHKSARPRVVRRERGPGQTVSVGDAAGDARAEVVGRVRQADVTEYRGPHMWCFAFSPLSSSSQARCSSGALSVVIQGTRTL